MNKSFVLALVTFLWGNAHAAQGTSTPVGMVAFVEVGIINCKSVDPKPKKPYALLRIVINDKLPKKNYQALLKSPDFQHEKQFNIDSFKSLALESKLTICKEFQEAIRNPPENLGVIE